MHTVIRLYFCKISSPHFDKNKCFYIFNLKYVGYLLHNHFNPQMYAAIELIESCLGKNLKLTMVELIEGEE